MPAVDFFELAIEETPLNELTWNAAATPSRISTNLFYPPARTGRIAPTPQHLSRADEMRGIRGEVKRLIEGYEPAGVLTSRAYFDLLSFLLPLCGFNGVATAGGAAIADGSSTTATGVNALNSAIVNVGSTAGFESSGTFLLAGVAVTYTGKTATSFTGCGSHAATAGGESVTGQVPTGATRWVYTKRNAIDAKTARIRTNYADENVLLEGYGFGISSLGLNAEGELNADLMGLFMRRLAADTTTVPALQSSQITPARRGELIVKGLSGGGRLSDYTIALANPLERVRSQSLDPPSDWPDALEHGDEEVQVTGTIPKRILTGADMDALIQATTFPLLATWISKKLVAATAKPYRLWIDCPAAQYVSGEQSELAGNRRRYGFDSLDWFAAYDETAGYDCKITLVNATPAVETLV